MANNIPTQAPKNAQRLTITADQRHDGNWILVDNGGNQLESYTSAPTKEQALADAQKLWPAGFPWFGQKDGDGWSIVLDNQ